MTYCTQFRTFLFAAVAVALFTQVTNAATFYLAVDNSGDWNTLTNWNSAPNGSGSTPATMAGNDFDTNGKTARADGTNTFLGDSLTISGGALLVKRGSSNAVVANLISGGGTLTAAHSTDNRLLPTVFTNNATTIINLNGRPVHLYATTMVGAGDLSIASSGVGTFYFSATDASGYTGTIQWGNTNNNILDFDNDLISAGGLVALATSRINLDQNVTFAAATIAGNSLAPGTYSFAALNAAYDAIFVDGGSGSITVIPEPTTLALLTIGGLMLTIKRKPQA